MAVNNNIFTMKAVNDETTSALFSQLGGLLGVGRRSDGKYYLSDLCQAGSINKWAKCKPFRNSAWNFASDGLREDARRGGSDGVYYSLSPTFSPITGAITSAAAGIHTADVTYLAPRGGSYSEPNRIRDFNGYDHNAEPLPSADLPDEGYFNDSNFEGGGIAGITLTGVGTEDSETSVNIARILSRYELYYVYPCALLTDANGNSYITALDYHNHYTGEISPNPLQISDSDGNVAYANGQWYCRIQKPVYGTNTSPWNSAQSKMKLSLCLLYSAYDGGVEKPYIGPSDNLVSLDYFWVNIASNVALSSTNKIIPLYGALNKAISLSALSSLPGYYQYTSISGSYGFQNITLVADYVGELSDNALSITAKITLTQNTNTYTATKVESITPNSEITNTLIVSFTADDFGTTLVQNTIYTATIVLTTALGSDSKSVTKRYVNVVIGA